MKGTVKGWVGIIRWKNNGRIEAVGVYELERDVHVFMRAWDKGVDLIAVAQVEIPFETKDGP